MGSQHSITIESTKALSGTSLRQPDPIPEAAISRVNDILRSGHLYRYNPAPGKVSEVALAEQEFAEAVGSKFAVGCNSGGSGITLALMCAGLKAGEEVLCNGLSFIAVPSAIMLAGGVPVYIEGNDSLTMDLEDLERKIKSGAPKYLCLTHMRGKVTDMDQVCALCQEYNVIMVEDCAHALGVFWRGKHMGNFGVAAAWSLEQKLLGTGEGGFVTTSNEHIAAKAIVASGGYEANYKHHVNLPSESVVKSVLQTTPCFSMRMHTLAAALMRPQLAQLEERLAHYRRAYEIVTKYLVSSPHFKVPQQLDGVTACALSTLQFSLLGFSPEEASTFVDVCDKHGVWVECFGSQSNCRNFATWQFSKLSELPTTAAATTNLIDVKLPLSFDESQFHTIGALLVQAADEVAAVTALGGC